MDVPPVQYVTTSDGYSIAFSVCGEGLPLVFMPGAASHLQLNWTPARNLSQWLPMLSERFQLICYDGRGQGMSARGLDPGYSMHSLVLDLEAIIERLHLNRFVLLGSHAGGHAAITYAVAHPSRVHALILTPTSLSGAAWAVIANVELARQNWEFFLSFFTALAPTEEQRGKEKEVLQQSVTQADWCIMASAWRDSNIEAQLPAVRSPTLVLHPRDYINIPIARSATVAAQIPNARMTLTEGNYPYGGASSGIRAIEEFLAGLSDEPIPAGNGRTLMHADLSVREIEVLRLIAAGLSNQQIADQLVISINTVRRHVSNILDKTGVSNRAQAVAFARDQGLH